MSTSAKELPNLVRLNVLDGKDLVVPCLLVPFVSAVGGMFSVSGKSMIERLTYMLPPLFILSEQTTILLSALPK